MKYVPFVSGFFHSSWHLWDASMLLRASLAHPFSLMCCIPQGDFNTVCLSIPLLMDVWVVSKCLALMNKDPMNILPLVFGILKHSCLLWYTELLSHSLDVELLSPRLDPYLALGNASVFYPLCASTSSPVKWCWRRLLWGLNVIIYVKWGENSKKQNDTYS